MGKVIDFPMSAYKLTPEDEQAPAVSSQSYPEVEISLISTEFFNELQEKALSYDDMEVKYIKLLEEHKKLLEQCVENK